MLVDLVPEFLACVAAPDPLAAYYTYLWSMTIAKDLRTAFGDDLMDVAVARRYRDRILAPGGTKPAAELVGDFLGRPYDLRAFKAWLAPRD